MTMPRKLPVDFGVAFPYGAYAVSEVSPVVDFDRSTADTKVQQLDKETGLPLWQVEVVDADPDCKKATRTVVVKFATKVQPVPPNNDGNSPFTPIVLEKLLATPYVEQVTETFSRVAWSYRAEAMSAPGRTTRSTSDKSTPEKSVA